MAVWLETYCTNLKPYTRSSYAAIIRNHIAPNIGTLNLQAIRNIHVQKFYNRLNKQGLSAKTVRNIGAVLHKSLSQAIKQGYIATNPCDGTIMPTHKKREIQPLTDAEIPLFLHAIGADTMGNAFALCLLAGLREGECLGLPWDNVDFENGTITVSQQLQKTKEKGGAYYIANTTKSGRTRVIRPPAIAFDYLRQEWIKQAKNRLQAGELWDNPYNLVFTTETGRYCAIFTFYKHFKQIACQIGRPDARPHDLRHTAATVAIASGADIKSVQDLLGHATASFTLNVYAHTSEKMAQDTADRVQGYYDNIKTSG